MNCENFSRTKLLCAMLIFEIFLACVVIMGCFYLGLIMKIYENIWLNPHQHRIKSKVLRVW